MLHSRWAILVAVSMVSPLLAQEEPPSRPGAKAPFEATVGVEAREIRVSGTSASLPDGTRLSVSLTIDGAPTDWRRVYVMKGLFSIAISRETLRPASYEALVRYEARGQIRELAKALAKFPIQAECRVPFSIGSPLDAARNSLAEGQMVAAALVPIDALLDKLDLVAKEQGEAMGQGKYQVASARAAYEGWLRERAEVYQPVDLYTRKYAVHYRPGQIVGLVNLYLKVERYGRDTHYDECMKAKVDPHTIPAAWSPKSGLVTPPMIRAYLKTEVPTLAAAVEARIAADAARVEALERAAAANGSGSD